eukprot:2895903-Amphidinium_carterae.1
MRNPQHGHTMSPSPKSLPPLFKLTSKTQLAFKFYQTTTRKRHAGERTTLRGPVNHKGKYLESTNS